MVTYDFRLPKTGPSPTRTPSTFPLPPPPSDWYALRKDVEASVAALGKEIVDAVATRCVLTSLGDGKWRLSDDNVDVGTQTY